MRTLITGGAGFIGSHLTDHLIERGHDVRVLDDLVTQVHGNCGRPDYLNPRAQLIGGDVRDPAIVRQALDGVDAVVHLAARVGVGQSMYEIEAYTSTNSIGTAVLLEALIEHRVRRLVVASSMSLYGEGLYRNRFGELVDDADRTSEQMKRGEWDPPADDGTELEPVPTPEWKTPRLASVYALSKFDQERLALIVGGAYDIPTVALRFFNVYGTRQALSNPYTGVLAIFAARLLNERPPLLFEDGNQRRDFVSVHDVVQACRLALERPAEAVAGHAFNIGSGISTTVSEVALLLGEALGANIEPEVTGQYRLGDVRHCFADIGEAIARLTYSPRISFEEGLLELTAWLADQHPEDLMPVACREIESRGLSASPVTRVRPGAR
jgi:dTDP-L-rhamnose 4-epimerase